MKKLRRIEIVRYSRRVTLISKDDTLKGADGAAADILLEAIGDPASVPEASPHEGKARGRASTRQPLSRRLLNLSVRKCFPFRSEDENTNRENEP